MRKRERKVKRKKQEREHSGYARQINNPKQEYFTSSEAGLQLFVFLYLSVSSSLEISLCSIEYDGGKKGKTGHQEFRIHGASTKTQQREALKKKKFMSEALSCQVQSPAPP